jgi:hypothetical protein
MSSVTMMPSKPSSSRRMPIHADESDAGAASTELNRRCPSMTKPAPASMPASKGGA